MKNKIIFMVVCVGIMLINVPVQVGFYDQYQRYLNKTTAQRLGAAAVFVGTAYLAYQYVQKATTQQEREEPFPQNAQPRTSEEGQIVMNITFDDPNYFNYLGVESTTTTQEINSAYKKKSLQWHPDKYANKFSGNKGRQQYAQEMFNKITEIRNFLLDDEKRKQYKIWLNQWMTNPVFEDCGYYEYLKVPSYAQDKLLNEAYDRRKQQLEAQLDQPSVDEWKSIIQQIFQVEKAYYILKEKNLRDKYYRWRLSPASGCK